MGTETTTGAGSQTGAGPGEQAGQTGTGKQGAGLTATSAGTEADDEVTKAFETLKAKGVEVLTKEETSALVASRLDEEKRRREREQVQQQKVEADKKMQEAGQHEELARQRGIELEQARADLKSMEEEVARYRKAMEPIISEETKDWPASFKKADPGVDKPLERFAWFELMRGPATDFLNATANGNGGKQETRTGGNSGIGAGVPQPTGSTTPGNFAAGTMGAGDREKYIQERLDEKRAVNAGR